MSKPDDSIPLEAPERSSAISGNVPKGFIVATLAVLLAFAWPLYLLLRFSIGHELYSHIVLIPVISGYLVWQIRDSLSSLAASPPNRKIAVILFVVGAALAATFLLAGGSGRALALEDFLALATLSFLFVFAGVCSWFLGRKLLRVLAFPLAFLLFMVPMPVFMTSGIETFLQHGSAAVAEFMFKAVNTTVYARGLVFQLPGITIEVAPECSGIHSTLALFITSVLAGYYFLRSPVRRTVLALAVIPLALVRNGFRVFVIGQLCVHISPAMIDSYIHRHGGPIFFVLSLIPFFALLYWLVRQERRASETANAKPNTF